MSQDEKEFLSSFILTQFARLEDRVDHRFDRIDDRLDELEERQNKTKLKLAVKCTEQEQKEIRTKDKLKSLSKIIGIALLAGSGGGLTFSAVVKALLPGG